jgi:sarcosine oxidase gamma subunit
VRAACTASAAVKVGGRVHRAKATRTVSAGKATTLRLRFSRASTTAIRAALRRGGLRASVTLTASAAGGAKGTARRTVRLSR